MLHSSKALGESSKRYALVDCNAFFCSCEQLFDPRLKDKAVVVLSSNDGCAISRTKQAKLLGIPMGAPYFAIEKWVRQKKLIVFSSNFSLYQDISARVMDVLKDFCPQLEIYSIDEAFLEFDVSEDVIKIAHNIVSRVRRDVGIPVSIGIAPTRTLAKLANGIVKKNEHLKGVLALERRDYIDRALEITPIIDVWGIGKGLEKKLLALNIKTAKDLAYYQNFYQLQKLGTKRLRQVQEELCGCSCLRSEIYARHKEIAATRSFGKPLYTKNDLAQTLAKRVSEAAQRMRRQKSRCSQILIFIQTSPFGQQDHMMASHHIKMPAPTANTSVLISNTLKALDEIYQGGFRYKKSGILLKELVDEESFQLDMFSFYDEQQSLMLAMDELNTYHGYSTLYSAACGLDTTGAARQQRRSPRYTTHLNELLRAH